MPLVYQQNINPFTKIGVWHITEPENFFITEVPLQREITHPHKRLQHLAGRYLLKQLYPDFPYELIRIAATRKPFLENEAYHFSISHCAEYAAVIVSTHYRVGVDIERVTEKVKKIKHKYLSPQEQAHLVFLAQEDEDKYTLLLTTAWSIKESLFKWYGDGEVDFIEHLHIEKIEGQNNELTAYCTVTRKQMVRLHVQCLIFNNNCLSWVITQNSTDLIQSF